MGRNREEGMIHPTCLTLRPSAEWVAALLPGICPARLCRHSPACAVCHLHPVSLAPRVTCPLHSHMYPLLMAPGTQTRGRMLQPPCWQLCCEYWDGAAPPNQHPASCTGDPLAPWKGECVCVTLIHMISAVRFVSPSARGGAGICTRCDS